ncbi:unnamed protein product, partial [Mesorhabditis belari]|uniref:Conserved oligomeric Golgi complex subunit 8 n=1 Tax=Mesorhabditis belari TaxID=2138241 RepID=A0AAF3FMK9_9BILA
MDLSARMEAERELGKMGADQLKRERVAISNDLKRLQDQIGDLAFNNYRTYANANRTTKHCQQTFSELNGILGDMSHQIPSVVTEVNALNNILKKQRLQTGILQEAAGTENPIKKILEMPALMDLCIRTGSYDAAYALTNFGMTLNQQIATLPDGEYKKLFTDVAERLIASRSFLLEELFNKFGGPLDLAESIQVVKNVRKIPYLTSTQLRVSILQYRDLYLDKQILDVSANPEFALQAIEIYRNCMYDTMVLYMAVFPENEIVRRDPGVDPRWEQWSANSPSSVLAEWAIRNVYRLLELIERADMKSQVDMSAVWNKLMAFGASFGRMGLDFRPLIADSLMTMVKKRFVDNVRQVTHRLVNDVKRIEVHGGDANWDSAGMKANVNGGPPQPAAEISMCDELCIYGNGIVESLNVLRYSLSPILLPFVVSTLRDSLLSIFSWLSSHRSSVHFSRAVRILAIHLIDFFNKCILFYFPYSTINRLYGSSLPRHEYEKICHLNVRDILNECDGGETMKEILQTDLEPPKVDDDVLETLLAKKIPIADFSKSEDNDTTSEPPPEDVLLNAAENAPNSKQPETLHLGTAPSSSSTTIPNAHPDVTIESTQLSDMDITESSSLTEALQTDSTPLSSMDLVTTSSGRMVPTDVTSYNTARTSVRFSIDGDEDVDSDDISETNDLKTHHSFQSAHSPSNMSIAKTDTLLDAENSRGHNISIESVDEAATNNDEWGWGDDSVDPNEPMNDGDTVEIDLNEEHNVPPMKSPKKDGKAD